MLRIRPTTNTTLNDVPFDFQVFDDSAKMHAAITAKKGNNCARVAVSNCWRWAIKRNPKLMNLVVGDYEC